MKASFGLCLALAIVLVGEVSRGYAQAPGLEIRPRRANYQVTLENGMNFPIIMKVAHPEQNVGNYRYDLAPGEYITQNFLGGDRVVLVWDRRGAFQFAAPVIVDQSGVLVVQSPYEAPVGAAAPANSALRSAAPGSPAAVAAPAGRAGGLSIRPEGSRPRAAGERRPAQLQAAPGGEPR